MSYIEKIREKVETRKQAEEDQYGAEKNKNKNSDARRENRFYQNIIDAMNKKHAVIMLGGKCQILTETIDPVFNRPDITFSSINDLKNLYANKLVDHPTKENKKISTFDLWFYHPKRREYQGIVFDPGRNVPGYYNLYRGLAVKPKKGDWSLYRELIETVIADGNPERAKYILAWMARIVQDPGGERPGTAIVGRGKQGIGKGVFVNEFGSLLGNHYLQIAHSDQVTGRFNSHMKNALLLFVDEGFWGGNKQAEGAIRNLITEPFLTIEQKGKDVIKVKNNINLVIASNNDWVVPAGLEERRFLVLDVPDIRRQDHKFFKALCDQMDNGGREALLYDLLRIDYKQVDLRTIERTQGLFDQILSSMDTVEGYWFEKLKEGALLPGHNDWRGKASSGEQYSDYIRYATTIGCRYPLCKQQFGRKLSKLCKGITKQKIRLPDGGRDWTRFFPNLEECRKQFESLVNMPIEWDHDDETPF